MSIFYLNTDAGRDHVETELIQFIHKLPKDKPYKVKIERQVKERTSPQNRALFGVAYPPLSHETGFTIDELHDAFCRRFFGTVEKNFGQIEISKPVRTTTTDENGKRDVVGADIFSRFYNMVQQIGAESGVYIPDPEPTGLRQGNL